MWRTALLILPIAAVFGIAVYYMIFAWGIGGDVQIGAAGYIAMVLGVVVTLALAGVLIALLLRRDPTGDG